MAYKYCNDQEANKKVALQNHGRGRLHQFLEDVHLQMLKFSLDIQTPAEVGYLDTKNIPKTPNLSRCLDA